MYVIEKIEETTTTWALGDYVIPLEAFDVDPSGKLKWEKELNKKVVGEKANRTRMRLLSKQQQHQEEVREKTGSFGKGINKSNLNVRERHFQQTRTTWD